MLKSPYVGHSEEDWFSITKQLVSKFPLPAEVLVSTVNDAWNDVYSSSFGDTALVIGRDIFLPAQATGVILERLIAARLSRISKCWRGGDRKTEKDIVCLSDPRFCFEIKTSSSKKGLFGNRSTGHRAENRRKFRTGYYLVINYKLPTETDIVKKIWSIRFGWIDDEDWVGQKQPTGQQASIGASLARLKLVTLSSNFD